MNYPSMVRKTAHVLVDAYATPAQRILDRQEQLIGRARPEVAKSLGELQIAIARRLVLGSRDAQHFVIG